MAELLAIEVPGPHSLAGLWFRHRPESWRDLHPVDRRARQRMQTMQEIVLGKLAVQVKRNDPDATIPAMNVQEFLDYLPVATEEQWGMLSALTLAGKATLVRF